MNTHRATCIRRTKFSKFHFIRLRILPVHFGVDDRATCHRITGSSCNSCLQEAFRKFALCLNNKIKHLKCNLRFSCTCCQKWFHTHNSCCHGERCSEIHTAGNLISNCILNISDCVKCLIGSIVIF